MPKLSPEKRLATAINRLRSERAALILRVSDIDASFSRLGIVIVGSTPTTPAGPVKLGKRRGRPPGSKNASMTKASKPAKAPKLVKVGNIGKRKRGNFSIVGDESILAFIKSVGEPTTAEINAHWAKEGRKATANTPLSNLVKAGKLKRVEIEGVRGSRYKIA